MTLFQKIFLWLKKPYPGPESFSEEIKGSLIASVIVFTFLYTFRPFGIDRYLDSVLALCFGFGLIAFFTSLFHTAFFRFIFNTSKDVESWNILRWIIDLIILLLLIAIANYFYVLYIFSAPFSLYGFMYMLFGTVMVGIFPVLFFGYRNQLKLEKIHRKNATEISKDLSLHSGAKDNTAGSHQIIALESMQNYVHFYVLNGSELKKETKRHTLLKAKEELIGDNFIKCHRSFIIDIHAVKKVTGNAQGLKLTMKHPDCPKIPVSRTYIKFVKLALLNSANEYSSEDH